VVGNSDKKEYNVVQRVLNGLSWLGGRSKAFYVHFTIPMRWSSKNDQGSGRGCREERFDRWLCCWDRQSRRATATRRIECESEKGGGKVQKSPQRSCKVRVRWLQQLERQRRDNCWYNNWYKCECWARIECVWSRHNVMHKNKNKKQLEKIDKQQL